jgi:hypothetical protein
MIKRITTLIAISLLVCASARIAAPVWADSSKISWTPANPMHKARGFFVANELRNGDILVAGGYDGTQNPPNFADSEIYNQRTGVWTPTTPMNQARAAPVSVGLEDGRVMVIGGFDENFGVLASAEIYDSGNATWTSTAPMNDARAEDFVAVLLPGHKVLVAGGTASDGVTSLNSAEIYDEALNTWTPTGSMNVGRGEFSTVVLRKGEADKKHGLRVLAVGGIATDASAIASAEAYDPASATWTLTGSMHTGRNDFGLTVLQDGSVLATGGGRGDEHRPRHASAEIFDPQTGKWSFTGRMATPRSEMEHAVVLLRDGRVLAPGGYRKHETPTAAAEIYNPESGTWTKAGHMSDKRTGEVALVLRGDRGVLVMGGLDQSPATTASVDIGRIDEH